MLRFGRMKPKSTPPVCAKQERVYAMKTITVTNIKWAQECNARERALAYLEEHQEEPHKVSEMAINDEIVQERCDLPYEVTVTVDDYADDCDVEKAVIAEAMAMYHYVGSCEIEW